jgi:hypothetical protein
LYYVLYLAGNKYSDVLSQVGIAVYKAFQLHLRISFELLPTSFKGKDQDSGTVQLRINGAGGEGIMYRNFEVLRADVVPWDRNLSPRKNLGILMEVREYMFKK